MSILVTQSLHGSISFYRGANVEWREKAHKSLCELLGRVYPDELPEPAQRGIDFENTIFNMIRSNRDIDKVECSEYFKIFIKACKGGKFQKKVKAFLTIDGDEYCIYGKIDVAFPNKIIDIKTTGKWTRWSEENYYKQVQHHFYCWIERIKEFEYMIAIFNDKEKRVVDYRSIPYEAMEWGEEEKLITQEIRDMRDFLEKEPELFDLWHNTYSLY